MLGTGSNFYLNLYPASFLTNYNRLLRGHRDPTNFNPQQVPYDVKMPHEIGTYHPKNQFPTENRNYIDTQANSKHYFPYDSDLHQNQNNIYNNKPINDISNQQNLYLTQQRKFNTGTGFDPFPPKVLS